MMKNFAKAALLSAAMLAALNGTSGAEAQMGPCDDDAPGMEGCSNKGAAASSNKEGGATSKAPRTMRVLNTIVYDQATFLDVNEDMVFLSDTTIDSTNLHFTVRTGATLTFRAPAIKIARDEASVFPLFELSGTVKFEAVGSVPALLDGNLVDEAGLVQVDNDNAVFLSDQGYIVRYHASGVTVSMMDDTESLDAPRHDKSELSPLLKASLAASHAKLNAESEVPSSSSSSVPFSTSSSPFTSETVGNDVESDVCAVNPFFGTPGGPGSCPSPTLSPADPATTTISDGRDKEGTHANSSSADCNGDTCTSTHVDTRLGGNSSDGSGDMEQERRHDDSTVDRSNNHGAEPGQTTSTKAPPSSKASDVSSSESSPKSVLTVGYKLAEPLVSSTGKSALWAAKHGSIVFAKETAKPSDVSGHKTSGGLRTSVLVAADNGKLKRVLRARKALLKEMRDGALPAQESRRNVWGWVSFRSRHQEDIERVKEHLGEVDMTLSDRGCVEVSLDGTCVLSKSGPYKREWMNRFPWRRSKSNDYQLHLTDDGMEVRLGERTVWGVAVDEMMG